MSGKENMISGNINRIKTWVKKVIQVQDTNLFAGTDAGKVTTADRNSFVGNYAGHGNTTGQKNNYYGYETGYSAIDGDRNTYLGYVTGHTNLHGCDNISVGYAAGFYETGDKKLFVDIGPRTNEADARVKALIYGIFDAATANQLLRLNGILELTEITNYADNAAAVTGGLTVGQVYRSGDSLNIVHA